MRLVQCPHHYLVECMYVVVPSVNSLHTCTYEVHLCWQSWHAMHALGMAVYWGIQYTVRVVPNSFEFLKWPTEELPYLDDGESFQ